MLVKVKNLNGSSKYENPSICKCDTWLEHWINNSNFPLNNKCRGCHIIVNESQLVGGHVIKCNSNDKSHYIIPLCRSCNALRDGEFSVDERILVNVNSCSNQ